MKALTKRRISLMAYEIAHGLMERGCNDTRIYYNDKALDISFNTRAWLDDDADSPLSKFATLKKINGINPLEYFEYAATNHILSMSFEGELYNYIYEQGEIPAWLENVFKKYGVYYELGNQWNLTCYAIDDNMKVDYTFYSNTSTDPIYLFGENNGIFQKIMDEWHEKSRVTGDIGSCVLGAGMSFNYKGAEYFMSAQSPWQGCCSWEAHIDWVKQELEKLGCTEVYYKCGHMD